LPLSSIGVMVVSPMVKLPVLATVIETLLLVVEFPAASRAVAVTLCVPLGTVILFQVVEYGDVVSSLPALLPSILNCTPETPTLSAALALRVTLAPETVAPALGAVRLTVGGVGSVGGGGGVGVGGGVIVPLTTMPILFPSPPAR
jgi:hypothetical protein